MPSTTTENAQPLPFSTSPAPIKSKRHSLNIISPGPRPLQLVPGSVLSSPSNSASRSPALHDICTDSPSGPLSPFSASSVRNGRRQSSISYFPANRNKDGPTSLLQSPLSPTGFSRNSAAAGSGHEMERGSRVVIGATSAVTLDALKQLNGRSPATLVEKHAELLHFIAQKESKCLELRSQLATHEAELLQLKRKWERIINRGFEKASHSSVLSPSTPSTASSLTTSTATTGSGVVLEGIKEGVQGMGRFITAGLGSISQGNTPVSPSTSTPPATSRGNRRLSSKFPVPLRLSSENNYGHESRSSSSTSTSVTTVASSSTSATSLMSEQGTTQALSPPFTSTSDEAAPNEHDDFGDFEEAPARSLNDLAEENPEQVLMVHDTGATPTMSPNPHFQRRDRIDIHQDDPVCELDSGWDDGWTTSGALTTAVDDRIGDLMSRDCQAEASFSSPATHTVQSIPTKPPKIETPSLPGVSSIPGLASSSMSMNGATPPSMSAWMGSVGKKWDEIRESQTFTKSQKRASILLSDVSQSIVSALISPSPLSTSPRSVATSKYPLEHSFTTTNAFHTPSHPINTESTLKTNKNQIPISTSLLDDLDDVGEGDEALKLGIGSPVLIPDQASKNNNLLLLKPSTKLKVKVMDDKPGVLPLNDSNSIDDEDWNW